MEVLLNVCKRWRQTFLDESRDVELEPITLTATNAKYKQETHQEMK